jgi:hypothetical protein
MSTKRLAPVTLVDVATNQAYVLRQNLFDQEEVWVQRGGIEIDIDMMELSHVENVIKMLERSADALHWNYYRDWAGFMDGPLGPGGDMATMAAESFMGDLAEQHPQEWLDSTILMKALRARLASGKPPVRRIKSVDPFKRSLRDRVHA